MDRSKARAIVKNTITKMRWALQLDDWKIEIVWGRIEDSRIRVGNASYGRCTADPRYHRATIELDECQFDTKVELLRTLRHEMLHIYAAEFHTYRAQVHQLLDDKTAFALDEASDRGHEDVVRLIENMLDFGQDLRIIRGLK